MEIKTKLIGKETLFKMIALANATSLPLLLVGEPGVAKTQAAIDYADAKDWKNFIIQLSLGTRPSAVVGQMDIPLLMKGEQRTISPLADAQVVVIDEVDKGSNEIRNTLLSVMRERKLLLGGEGVRDCKWEVFIGACNEIPAEERNSPFWDRFVLKYTVDRVPIEMFQTIWEGDTHQVSVDVKMVNHTSRDTLTKLGTFLYKHLTDRTLTHLPKILEGVKGVFGYGDAQAAVFTCSLVAPGLATKFAEQAFERAYIDALAVLENVTKTADINMVMNMLSRVEGTISTIRDRALQADIRIKIQDIRKKLNLLQEGIS